MAQVISHYDQIKRKPGYDAPVRVTNRAGLLASTNQHLVYEDATGVNRFVLSSDQASATDNVLRIARTDTTIVERVWDGVNFWVDWIPMETEIGVHGTTSATYTGDKIRWAALITHDTCRLRLLPDTNYICNYKIATVAHHLIGSNSKITRSAQISATTTAQTEIGGTVLTVNDTSGFTIGSPVYAVLTPGVIGTSSTTGHAMAAEFGAGFFLVSKTATTLTFASPVVKTVPIGTKVVILDHMLEQSSLTIPGVIEGIEFDGNSSEHDDVLDFAAGWSVLAHNCEVKHCIFRNAPNENLAISSGSVHHCRAYDLWGSFVHGSAVTTEYSYGLEVHNNYGEDIATKFNYHNEGVITFSVNCRNYRIYNNVFDNRPGGVRGTGCFGNMSANSSSDDDGNFVVYNNKFHYFDQVITISSNASTENFDQATFDNCVFDDVSRMTIGGITGAVETPYINRIMVRNCEFTNTRFEVFAVRDFQFLDNKVSWNVGGTGLYIGQNSTVATFPATRLGGGTIADGDWAFLYADDGANDKGVYLRTGGAWVFSQTETDKLPWSASAYAGMYIVDCGKVTIRGGSFAGPGCVPNEFRYGIKVYNTEVIYNASGATDTYFNQDFLLADIDLIGWHFSMAVTTEPYNASPGKDVSGWRYSRVNVWPMADNLLTYIVGLDVPAGCIADNCAVYLPDTATNALASGIQLKGPVDVTKRVGGIARNCYVPRAPGSALAIRLGNTTDTARNANCIAINNLVAKAPAQAGSRDAIISGNVLLDTSTLPGYNAPIQIPHNEIGKQGLLY